MGPTARGSSVQFGVASRVGFRAQSLGGSGRRGRRGGRGDSGQIQVRGLSDRHLDPSALSASTSVSSQQGKMENMGMHDIDRPSTCMDTTTTSSESFCGMGTLDDKASQIGRTRPQQFRRCDLTATSRCG